MRRWEAQGLLLSHLAGLEALKAKAELQAVADHLAIWGCGIGLGKGLLLTKATSFEISQIWITTLLTACGMFPEHFSTSVSHL